jgi:type III restriction enzyme
MKLLFKEQDFQVQAVKAVTNCFAGQPRETNRFTLERSKEIIRKAKAASVGQTNLEMDVMETIGYRNRPIQITEDQLLKNIKLVQHENDIPESDKLERPKGLKLGYNLTIEMETGTGKTYTYIRTMYELHQLYGWSKFIIIVPSIAIREGVYKSFEVTQDHFQELYGHHISPFIYNSGRPEDIETFASFPRISVMIINTQAFSSKKENDRSEAVRRIYKELDQFGTRKPIDIIAQTNPIIIIDEPQSVDGDKTLESMQDFRPLFTLRYSATHKNEYNKVYRLDALDAYNKKLVKKIQVKGISLKGSTGTTGYLYLEQIQLSTNKAPVAIIEYEIRSGTAVKRVREKLEKGANLFELSGEMPQYKNWIIQDVDGYFNKIIINGQEIVAGEAIGDLDEKAFRRIQIRETIISHLSKERELFEKGIKVLSLFFIDSVAKYRIYDGNGEKELGEYAKIFEEEYNLVRSDFLDLLHPEYNKYLSRDDAEIIHDGYFSMDKNKRLVEPTIKRGKEETDDISGYDLIMKNKERLLSLEEPIRFLFSHSALKEGWDNPNVFQICTLKYSDSDTRRRQEVGRGMRLCVNEYGVRQDYETVGEQVHDINRLTIVASESYETFAKLLQEEILKTLKERLQKVSVEFLAGLLITDEKGKGLRLTQEEAKKLNKFLYKHDVLDDDDKITTEGRQFIDGNTVPIPENLEVYRASITSLLRSIYTGEGILPENDRDKITLTINPNFYKKEFQELWSKINLKTIYEVQFDSVKLINDAKIRINAELHIAERTYEVRSGELKETSKEELIKKEGFIETPRESRKLKSDIYTNTVYDIVGEIVKITNLTRRTVVEILKAINPEKFFLLRKNPEEFIAKSAKLINEEKASLIINNIVYHKTEDRHDAKTVFANDKSAIRQSEFLRKHIYDYLTTDSTSEATFAKALENSKNVYVYAKLPRSFYITTPVANYSPDWAIVFDKESVRHIYFVAETKGSDSDLELRKIEALKIHCAGEHFKTISGQEVQFSKVSSYEKMLEIVQVK